MATPGSSSDELSKAAPQAPLANLPTAKYAEEIRDTSSVSRVDRKPILSFDKPAFPNGGYDLASSIQRALAQEDVLSCVIDTVALRYYGGPFLVDDFQLCVPSAMLDFAADLVLRTTNNQLRKMDVREVDLTSDERNGFPTLEKSKHFEHRTHAFTLRLCPSTTAALDSVFEKPGRRIVQDTKSGLSYPALKEFVQSALDSGQYQNLENVVDGMNLSNEWAERVGIDLVDAQDPTPVDGRSYSRRQMWDRVISNKQKRIGGKKDPKYYATCFRRYADGDMTAKIKCVGDSDAELGILASIASTGRIMGHRDA